MRHLRDNLLVQFSVASFAIMAVIALVLAIVLSNKIQADAVQDLVDEAVGTSSPRLLSVITPADLEEPMVGARYDEFHQFVQTSIVSERTARIKLWAADGTVIYSSDPASVGEKFPDKENLLIALRGEAATEVKIPEDPENERERYLGTLMEVYTPIVFPGSTEPQGALEIYQYYAPTAQRIDSMRQWLYGAIGVGFVILYGSLISIVWGGWRTIKRQQSALAETNEEVRITNCKLEEALIDLQRTQQQVIQEERLRGLGQMASGIAHDFNNSLTPILGFSELLLESDESLDDKEKVKRYAQMINTSARDAAKVVSRMREFYRKRDEGERLALANLHDLVAQAISLTQPKWKDEAQAHGVSITVETDLQQVPAIPCNESELREVLINLILNAVDAMPEGGTITLRTRPDGEYVALEVSDTGEGMTEEVRNSCFDPFFTTKGAQGTGMGLAMVYGIVLRHEGTIEVESEVGRGTTFIIRLPVQARSFSQAKDASVGQVLTGALHILVVDDEPAVRQLINEYMRQDGHTVETAADGREGLEKFRSSTFDLVLTDRAMPGMSGDQLAGTIKQEAPGISVILLTGYGEMMKDTDEKPAGVDLVVSKPITIADLRRALAQVTDQANSEKLRAEGATAP